MNNITPVWDEVEAIDFIAQRCDINKDVIAKVLGLEAEYMESIGIAIEENSSTEDGKSLFDEGQRISEPWKTDLK